MAEVLKKRRLVNPGRRRAGGRRKLTPKQIKYFGTARQRAGLKAARSRKRSMTSRVVAGHRRRRVTNPTHRRRRTAVSNIGEIITIGLGANPGSVRREGMARRRRRTKKRRVAVAPRRRRVVRRRRRSPSPVTHRRRRVYHRRRRGNPGSYRRHRSYRRNPGMMSGTAMNVVGVIGGAAVTKILSGQLPAQLQAGPLGYLSTGLVAVILGWGVGKFARKPALGNMMMIGGLTYTALRIMQDYFPSLSSMSPFGVSGMRGMGLVGPSSFYVPQVPMGSNMGSFVTPGAVSAAIPAMSGLGARRGPRTGRM